VEQYISFNVQHVSSKLGSYSEDVVGLCMSTVLIRKPSCRWQTRATLLKSGSRASKVTPFDSRHIVSYCRPIVTLCLKCTVFEISRHIGPKIAEKPTPLLFDAPYPANPRKYLHKPDLARNNNLWSAFLPLIVRVYLHSYVCGGLRKTYVSCKKRMMAVQGQFRIIQGHWFCYQSKACMRFPISVQ